MATEIIRPRANRNTLWTAYDYTLVLSTDGSYAYADDADDNKSQQWYVESPTTLDTITGIELFANWGAYDTDAPDWVVDNCILNFWIGGGFLGGLSVNSDWTGYSTLSHSWSGSWVPGDFATAYTHINPSSVPKDHEWRYEEVWLELTGTAASSGGVPVAHHHYNTLRRS